MVEVLKYVHRWPCIIEYKPFTIYFCTTNAILRIAIFVMCRLATMGVVMKWRVGVEFTRKTIPSLHNHSSIRSAEPAHGHFPSLHRGNSEAVWTMTKIPSSLEKSYLPKLRPCATLNHHERFVDLFLSCSIIATDDHGRFADFHTLWCVDEIFSQPK